jgi:hypothetical protein
MPSPAAADSLLDELVATTESLRDSARSFGADQASELLEARQKLLSSLRAAYFNTNLTAEQRRKLEQALRLGGEAREALLVRRETSRGELQEKLAGRHLSEAFKPYRPKKLGRLNIRL